MFPTKILCQYVKLIACLLCSWWMQNGSSSILSAWFLYMLSNFFLFGDSCVY
jgi:hypothetical protein